MGATASSSAGANRSADSVNSAAVDMAAPGMPCGTHVPYVCGCATAAGRQRCSVASTLRWVGQRVLRGAGAVARRCVGHGHCSCRGRVATGAVG